MKSPFRKNMKIIQFLLLALIVNVYTVSAQTGSNPIFRDNFTADPAPMVYDGTLYVYVGHDEAYNGEMFKMTEWLCYSTTDMINWTSHGSVMRPEDFKWNPNDPNAVKEAWAAQVVPANGKFYLYVTATYGGRNIGVAVSDSPTGPFVDARGTALVTDGMTNNGDAWDDIDPTVLIDDDGTAYLSWGNPNCYLAKLKPNMIELDGAIEIITPPNYGEGPWLSKRKGLYYLTYAAFPNPNGSEQICYSTATNIHGPWTYQGILTGSAKGSYTIHPGIINYKGIDYLFYHFADYTIGGYSGALGRRAVCVDYLGYNDDGTMKPVTQTLAGVTVDPPYPSNASPVISFTSPVNEASFAGPATIPLTVDFSHPNDDDSVVHIAYYNGDKLIVDKWMYPFTYSWENVAAGNYTISAMAYDLNGNSATDIVTIKVNPAQEAYQPNIIPGTIQFENYDIGGNGFAYYDDSKGSEISVDFRTTEDVDIEACTDADGGYNIGYATAGEWLEYTVDVETTGVYDLTLRAACNGDGRTVSLSSDGVDFAKDVVIPNTGGWQAWEYIKVDGVSLEAGSHVLRVTIGAESYVNLNYMTFSLVTTSVKADLKFEMKGLAVYPNPLQDNGIIKVPQVKDAKIIIYASNGEVKETLVPKAGETTISWKQTGITESDVYTVVLLSEKSEYARIQVYVVDND